MNETMTRDEIFRRFKSEWVLLGDPRTDESLEVLGGTVLFHGKDRDEVYQKAVELTPVPRRIAVLFTGPTPEHIAINL